VFDLPAWNGEPEDLPGTLALGSDFLLEFGV
jgi:hypothetical protein